MLKIEKQIKKAILSSFIQSVHGWKQWHEICKRYKSQKFLVICIPDIQSEYSKFAFIHLDDVVLSRGYESAVVITQYLPKVESMKKYASRILDIIYYTPKELQNIQTFYALCNFDNRFILATPCVPYGKGIEHIKHIPGFSYADIYAYGIYRLKPYSKYISQELQKRNTS